MLIDEPEVVRALLAVRLAFDNLPQSERAELIKNDTALAKASGLLQQFLVSSKSGVVIPDNIMSNSCDKKELNEQFTQPHVWGNVTKYLKSNWNAVKDSVFHLYETNKLPPEEAEKMAALFLDGNKEKTLKVFSDLGHDIKYENRNRYAQRFGLPNTIGAWSRQ